MYSTSDGYRCWRWNPEGIEMLEHRWLVDPGPGVLVHHRDGNRSNNALTNLRPVTSGEHGVEHRKVPDGVLLALHDAGYTTVEIGALVGLHHSQVSRRVRAAGRTIGPRPQNRVDVDLESVKRLHASGARDTHIAQALGITREVARRARRSLGLSTPTGRPPQIVAGR